MGSPVTDWSQVPGPPQAPAPSAGPAPGYGNNVLGAAIAAVQGLQQGHQERVKQEWDQAQRAAIAAHVAVDTAQQRYDQVKGLPDSDPHKKGAKDALDDAVKALGQRTKEISDMANPPAKAKDKGSGAQGSNSPVQQHQSTLGKLFQSIASKAMGATSAPPLSGDGGAGAGAGADGASSTPGFVGLAGG